MGAINQNLLFYKIMNYHIPKQEDIFEFQEKLNINNQSNTQKSNKTNKTNETAIKNDFSRNKKNKFMKKFIEKINKHWNLYRSLPFIEEIYLCNSITFNALKRESDIDLFIVAKKWHMWRARFFSAIFFKLNWLKRSMTNKKQKFCLSFYITQDNKNLYPLMIDKTDIYLTYRLAHLVPLYQENNKNTHKYSDDHNIYKNNKRLKSLMPNHPQEHCINIWSKLFTWKTKTKKRLEFWFGWITWKIIELSIKTIRLPILLYKIKKLWDKGKQIIISDKILKFHDDIRKQIQLLYQIAKKN